MFGSNRKIVVMGHPAPLLPPRPVGGPEKDLCRMASLLCNIEKLISMKDNLSNGSSIKTDFFKKSIFFCIRFKTL